MNAVSGRAVVSSGARAVLASCLVLAAIPLCLLVVPWLTDLGNSPLLVVAGVVAIAAIWLAIARLLRSNDGRPSLTHLTLALAVVIPADVILLALVLGPLGRD